MEEKMSIIVDTIHGKVPLDVTNPNFTWRELILPPIKAIVVQQGHHAAEIGEYTQYNFMVEVIQQTASMGGVGGLPEVSRFWVMGNIEKRVDLYIFHLYKGVITRFERSTEPWGAELDGASTTGWKLGATKMENGILA
jgi:hypothetical protein